MMCDVLVCIGRSHDWVCRQSGVWWCAHEATQAYLRVKYTDEIDTDRTDSNVDSAPD